MGEAGTDGETARRFAAAHRALLADPDMQFRYIPPPAPSPTPAWLRVLGEAIAWALRPLVRALGWLFGWLPDWPWARILLWSVLALLTAVLAWAVAERMRHGEWRLPRLPGRRAHAPPPPDDDAPFAAAPARAWLAEADALAAVGSFAEAAHLLLFRSVEDLARRRPRAVHPALTARELAAAPDFPPPVSERFAAIAVLVERSLFGGRPVDAAEWDTARTAYAELAQARTWRQ